MVKTKIISLIICLVMCLSLCACEANVPAAQPEITPEPSPALTPVPSSRVISAEEAKAITDSGEEFFLIDVRDRDEYETGHIPGAVCIPYIELEARRDELPENTEALILVYCRSGRRSAIAAQTLVNLGFGNVADFGGIIDWPYETTADQDEKQAACEHDWVVFDCLSERCTKCGKMRNYY